MNEKLKKPIWLEQGNPSQYLLTGKATKDAQKVLTLAERTGWVCRAEPRGEDEMCLSGARV